MVGGDVGSASGGLECVASAWVARERRTCRRRRRWSFGGEGMESAWEGAAWEAAARVVAAWVARNQSDSEAGD